VIDLRAFAGLTFGQLVVVLQPGGADIAGLNGLHLTIALDDGATIDGGDFLFA
jgi:hypothetical protein